MESIKYLEKSNIFNIWSQLVLTEDLNKSIFYLSRKFTLITGKNLLHYNYYYPIREIYNKCFIDLFVSRTLYHSVNRWRYRIISAKFLPKEKKLNKKYGYILFDIYIGGDDTINNSLYAYNIIPQVNKNTKQFEDLDKDILYVIKRCEKMMSMFLNFGCWTSADGFCIRYCL